MFGIIKFAISILWFVLTIGVLVNIWKEGKQETIGKLLWTVGVLAFPVLGPIIWILYGTRSESAGA
ncbi:MAG: PLDc N-terminal domain-containing protein [Bacteroidetes bacterium]|nr:PLDc N-terminal domain-containing protein [Bacteroidota bacterium]MCB0843962.1 PLDc N-terminal domain-containing protein [Bacteroidota bacterium]